MIKIKKITLKHNYQEKNIIRILFQWRYLLFQFVKVAFINLYKQTILGPIWNFINPIIFTGVFTIIFSKVAKLSTDEMPPFLFYLTSMILWNLFNSSLSNNIDNFQNNYTIYKCAYFPRILNPIATIIERLFVFCIQLVVLAFSILYFEIRYDFEFSINFNSILMILLIITHICLLAFSIGIFLACLNYKYRDIKFISLYVMQFIFYGTPIVYSINIIPENYKLLFLFNPIVYPICQFKSLILNTPSPSIEYLFSSIVFLVIFLPISLKYFFYVESKIDDYV